MRNHLLPLTSLRFFAAFFVLLSHLLFIKDNTSYSFLLVNDGFIGVTFFFILSGFILSYSYENKLATKHTSKKHYFIARIARIYPLHLLTLVISLPIVFREGASLLAALPNTVLLHAWIPVKEIYFSANSPSWSISTELFFYLAFPFLIFFKTRTLITIALTLISAQLITMLIDVHDDIEHALFYISPFSRISDFILGIIIFRGYSALPEYHKNNASIYQYASLGLFLVFIVMSIVFSVEEKYKYSVFYIIPMSFMVFSFALHGGTLGNILSHRYLILLGEASFALYLIHQLVIRYFLTINTKFSWFSDGQLLLLIFTVSIASSIILFKYFETPARKFLVKRFAR